MKELKTQSPPASKPNLASESAMPFRKANYRWLGIGSAILVLGYALLVQPSEYMPREQFSLALYVAPVLILTGIGLLVYAILRK
ncbi:MAG: DUF3098 domain-containing protein [Bacteroidia bacterium]|nr:DUF3098 domain-containing protein [Bacteroidia bacterium]MDW8236690.1 DUF3098 domain-containing protein [Bacteroidia bacterium]